MLKAIFFDRDGVINRPIVRGKVLSSPRAFTEFELYPGFIELYLQIEQFDLKLFVVSNQPDVERGLLPVQQLELIKQELAFRFKFTEILHCLHSDESACNCRKPKPGMIVSMLEKYSIDAREAILIGDSRKDIDAGRACGVETILLHHEFNGDLDCGADHTVEHLLEALPLIERARNQVRL